MLVTSTRKPLIPSSLCTTDRGSSTRHTSGRSMRCQVLQIDGSGKELRRFHDTAKQYLRALKAVEEDPNRSFVTALLELKRDKGTMFEWQNVSQDARKIPHYDDLLEFLNLRAQASETCSNEPKKSHFSKKTNPRSATSFAANAQEVTSDCFLYKTLKHPLYSCPQFRSLPHDKMLSTIRSSNVCLNSLKPGHF